MGISKREVAEVVLNRLNGGVINKDSKITIRQAAWAVGEARNYIIQQVLFQTMQAFKVWEVPFGVISEYDLPAKLNGKKWYVDLPVSPLNLINDLGIYQVFDVDCDNIDYTPTRPGFNQLYAGLEALGLEGEKGYEPIGNKLNLINSGFTEDKDNLMKVRMIANSHDLTMREDFMLPGELEDLVTARAFEKLAPQVQMPADYISDNTSKGKI